MFGAPYTLGMRLLPFLMPAPLASAQLKLAQMPGVEAPIEHLAGDVHAKCLFVAALGMPSAAMASCDRWTAPRSSPSPKWNLAAVPYSVRYDSAGGRVWVEDGTLGARLFVGRKRVYVAGGAGVTIVIRQAGPRRYNRVATIHTAPGARTARFVPEWGWLYLAVPHRGDQRAENRVYQAE